MLSGSPKFSMIVLKWYTATHERKGLLLIWFFWSSFLPEAERSLITVGRIGQRAGSPVIGGSSALKWICFANFPNDSTSARAEGAEAGREVELGAELLRGAQHLDRLVLAQRQHHAVGAGVFRRRG